MSVSKIRERITLTTPTGTVEVALFHVQGDRAGWFEVRVRDNRPGYNYYIGKWLSIRTYTDERAAYAGYEEWYAVERNLANAA